MDFNHNGKDDVQEIKDGFSQFKSDLLSGSVSAVLQDVTDAGAWLKGEIEGLVEEARNFFNWGLERVRAESASLGEAVANMLTLLANSNLQGALGVGAKAMEQLQALSSEVVTAAVGLLAGFKTATA